MKEVFDTRFRRFEKAVQTAGLDGFLVSSPPNIAYLFGFTGSHGLVFYLDGLAHLLLDGRYLTQGREQARNCRIRESSNGVEEDLKALLVSLGATKTVGFESTRLNFDAAVSIQAASKHLELFPKPGFLEELRMVKDEAELGILREAFALAGAVFDNFLAAFRTGLSEVELAGILEFECRTAGAEGFAFETIVASGPRTALPHGVASQRRIRADEPVLIDFGLRWKGYCTDLTRMVLPDESTKVRQILRIVEEAQAAALESIRPGLPSSQIDAAARQVISEAGFGENFTHSTGHGLGLEIHEIPLISRRRSWELKEGMVFTVEPGIYLPGEFGVRIEDVVVVTEDGCRVLSRN